MNYCDDFTHSLLFKMLTSYHGNLLFFYVKMFLNMFKKVSFVCFLVNKSTKQITHFLANKMDLVCSFHYMYVVFFLQINTHSIYIFTLKMLLIIVILFISRNTIDRTWMTTFQCILGTILSINNKLKYIWYRKNGFSMLYIAWRLYVNSLVNA